MWMWSAVLASCLLPLVLGGGTTIELQEDRKFKLELNQAQVTVVFFHLTYCVACRDLKPTWDQLVKKFQDYPEVRFLRVDGKKLEVTAKRNNVHVFPTILIFNQKRSEKLVYKGKKEVPAMFSAIDEELKYDLPKLITIQASDYTPLVFDKNADVVLLFLQQGCRGCLQAEKDMTEIMLNYHQDIGENSLKFLKNDASVSRVLARIYDIMEYPSVWVFPRNFKPGISASKGPSNITHLTNVMNFYFGYSDRWNLSTFGMRGRVSAIEKYLGPTLEDIRKQKLLGTELETMAGRIDATNQEPEKKFYIKCLDYFYPKREGMDVLRRAQAGVVDRIMANFENKKRSYEANEKLIAEWNVMQFYREFKYEPPKEPESKKRKTQRGRDEL